MIETVNEAIAEDNIADSNAYATKNELATAQNEAQKAVNSNTDMIYWLVEKLGLQSDFEAQF